MIQSKTVPLDRANVDTDQIVPKQFLKQVAKTGFGKYLFFDWRYLPDGSIRSDFVINQPKFSGRKILLTRENFGIGSSREHAVWALHDYGFQAVIAPSFADIFYENCFKNGLLPVKLEHQEVEFLFQHDCDVRIDLKTQIINACGMEIKFAVDPFRKRLLLEGIDVIELTLRLEPSITEYEAKNPAPGPLSS